MLCLSRNANDAVVLLLPDGRRVVLKVLEIDRAHGRGVRIGIDAPQDISIYRAELRSDHAMRQRIDAPPPRACPACDGAGYFWVGSGEDAERMRCPCAEEPS